MYEEFYHETCDVLCDDNGSTIPAVVLSFKERDVLYVVIHNAIKLKLKWNGYNYETCVSGVGFGSDGPVLADK
jgi:hypothetical protein